MIIPLSLGKESYDIVLERGSLKDAGKHLNLDRRVLVVTDDGVPEQYARCVAEQCKEPTVIVLPQGEQSKSLACFERLLSVMADGGFTRTDCVVAVGGGVMGDLAGFAASAFMRGIDFYNIPTTLLSQVDSSIGGKVAIDLGGYKNIIGAFYQPKKVIIDPDLLSTLDERQIRCGLAEALKMSVTSDPALFDVFERGLYRAELDSVIERSLLIKRRVVENDVRESGERRTLNFGHTIGHAIESSTELLHGECVALGMLYMCSESVKARLLPILEGIGLPTAAQLDGDTLYEFILRDKKADGDFITVTYVGEIGKAELRRIPIKDLKNYV